MALKVLELSEKRNQLEKELKEKRSKRVELNKKINEVADKVAAVDGNTTAAQKRSLEEQTEELEEEKESLDSRISKIIEELEEIEEEIKEIEKKAPALEGNNTGENKNSRSKYGVREYRSKDHIYNEREYNYEERGLDLGKCIRGMYTGDWKDADLERRAISTGSANSVIPAPLAAKIIDLARNTSVFAKSNVPTVVMESNTLKFARIDKDFTIGFKEEGEKATGSPMELSNVVLNAKTVYGYAYVTIEAIESAKNLENIITESFSGAIAEAIDKGFLYGEFNEDGEALDYAPTGIYNDPDVLSFDASGSNYDDVIKAIGMIRRNNGNPTAMAYNAATEEIFATLKDTTGQYLAAPKPVSELKPVVSNQLAFDEDGGSDIIVFDPNALVIGQLMNIRMKMFEGDSICIQNGMVCFRIAAMVDCVVTQPKHVCIIKGFGATSK